MTPEQRAREFVTVGFRDLGVPSLEPYIAIVAELIDGATAPLLTALHDARAELATTRDACKDLIPMAAQLGKPRWPVDGRLALLDSLIGRIDSAIATTTGHGGPPSAGEDRQVLKSADDLPANFGLIEGQEHPDTIIARASRNAALQECANIANAIDSGRGNEKEIARAVLSLLRGGSK